MSWSAWVGKKQPVANKEVTQEKSVETTPAKFSLPVKTTPQQVIPGDKILELDLGNVDISFLEGQAAIEKVIFQDYNKGELFLGNGLFLRGPDLAFKKNVLSDNKAEFVHKDVKKTVYKSFNFFLINT